MIITPAPTSTYVIAVGDQITGRDVTTGRDATGVVTSIRYPHGLGCFSTTPNNRPTWERRYRITTNETYSTGGTITAMVECAEPVASGTTGCDECGHSIPDCATSTVNGHHASSCSLYPSNVG